MSDPSFDEFVKLFRATQRCSKLAVGTPVLVRLGDDETDAAERLGFATESKRTSEPPGGKGKSLGSVTCIAKRMGAAFPDQISVGRASNTDLCLPRSSISKYHAFFSLGQDGIHTITDAGSRNGTWVNDSKLVPKRAVKLRDGDVVTLGSCDFVFYSYQGFVERLRKSQ